MYTIVVLIAVVTTLMAGPLLRVCVCRVEIGSPPPSQVGPVPGVVG